MARWTWVLHSWWAAHIKWQPWQEQMVQLGWILMSVSPPQQTQWWSLAGARQRYSSRNYLVIFLSQRSIKSSAYRVNLCAELPVGCWSYSHFLSIFEDRLELHVIVIGPIHRLGLTWDLLLLSTDEDEPGWWCVIHLIYCSWFNLIKCAVWLSGSPVKGIIHGGAVCYESQYYVICNRLWLRIAENAFSGIKGLALGLVITLWDKDHGK